MVLGLIFSCSFGASFSLSELVSMVFGLTFSSMKITESESSSSSSDIVIMPIYQIRLSKLISQKISNYILNLQLGFFLAGSKFGVSCSFSSFCSLGCSVKSSSSLYRTFSVKKYDKKSSFKNNYLHHLDTILNHLLLIPH